MKDESDREAGLRARIGAASDLDALEELAELVGRDRGRRAEAVALWKRCVQAAAGPRRGVVLLRLARAQVEVRRDDDAIETLQRCVTESPPLAEAFDLLGDLLGRRGRLEEAVSALGRAAELQPRGIRPRLALVTYLDALGRRQEAARVLQEVSELGADDPSVQALIREMMHRRG